jgi:hypothetical protein
VSRNSKLIFVAVLSLTFVSLLIVAFFSSSIANPAESLTLTQPTPTPTEAPTVTSTLVPTLTPAPTPTQTPLPSPTLIPNPVDFTCGDVGNPYAFTVTVPVDLNDGMNQAEAITVAEAIINHELTKATYEVKSVNNNSGLWNVDFSWEYTSFTINGTLKLCHFFDVAINPQNQTVTYNRCL